MQNALREYLNSKMTQTFGQSDNLLQHDQQYQALVSSFLNENSAGSNSSFVDESSKCQQTSHLDQSYSLMHKMKQEEQCVFIGNPQLPLKEQNPSINGLKPRKNKKARMGVNQEAALPLNEHVFHTMPQSQNSAGFERDQLHASSQHNGIPNQEQQAIMNTAPQSGVDGENNVQWMRHPIPQQEMVNQATTAHRPGVCSRRLMQYLYNIRMRPKDNNLGYWSQFVAEFFEPCAKRRWCLSCYDQVGEHAFGISPHAAMVSSFRCSICNSQSGRGFEVSSEVLPRLSKITFEGGVVDELLCLDMPRESRFSSGLLLLECERAVQTSVYKKLQVEHEGRLRIVFSPNMKIMSWEFCIQSHETFLRRTSVAPQVPEIRSAVRNYQCSIDERGSNGILSQDIQTCDKILEAKILEAGEKIEKALGLHEVDNWGLSKKFGRSLQMANVAESMKYLMTLCHSNGSSPIESLKSYGRGTPTKLSKKKTKGKGEKKSAQGLGKDANKLGDTSCGLIRSNTNQSCSSINSEDFSNGAEYDSINSRDSRWQTSYTQYASPSEGFKNSNSGLCRNSMGAGLSNSIPSVQHDPVQNLIQEFMNSRAANCHGGQEVNLGRGKSPAVDMTSIIFGRQAAAEAGIGNVLGSVPVATHQAQSIAALSRNLSSEVGGSFHGKVLLPEAGFGRSNRYHDYSKFYGMNYGWNA